MKNAQHRFIKFLGSKKFFYVVVGLFVFQALWMAFSYRYPSPYDEQFHLEVIQIYSHQLSPIIVNQDQAYDHLRDLTHESSHFYHYLMSIPYRLITLITSDGTSQIMLLRIINIGLAAWGLILFCRLFKLMKIKKIYINISLLFFSLIPIVSQVSSIINYDNLLFPLTAWYLLACVRLILRPKHVWGDYAGVIIIGTLASLVKYTFLPIFAVSVIYLAVVIYRRGLARSWGELVQSLQKSSKIKTIAAGALATVLIGLFVQLYVQNLIRYGTPQPACTQTLSEKRCLKSATEERNINAERTKNQRPLQSIERYSFQWYEAMQYSSDFTLSSTTGGGRVDSPPLPIFYALTFLGTVIGLGFLLYSWRTMPKNPSWYFLLTVSLSLVVVVFANNYSIYRQFHWALAIQPRYFLNVLPIIIVMIASATGYALRRHLAIRFAGLLLLAFLMAQGGGLATHILSSGDNWYWQNRVVIKANHAAKKILHPLVKE